MNQWTMPVQNWLAWFETRQIWWCWEISAGSDLKQKATSLTSSKDFVTILGLAVHESVMPVFVSRLQQDLLCSGRWEALLHLHRTEQQRRYMVEDSVDWCIASITESGELL